MQIKGRNLYSEQGMLLTDGNVYGRIIYLGEGDSVSRFYEVEEDALAVASGGEGAYI